MKTYTIDILDSVYATVLYNTKYGVFLKMPNDEVAFTKFSWLPPGSTVLCTVRNQAKGKRKMFVLIDSVETVAEKFAKRKNVA